MKRSGAPTEIRPSAIGQEQPFRLTRECALSTPCRHLLLRPALDPLPTCRGLCEAAWMFEVEHHSWRTRRAVQSDFPAWARMLASLHPDLSFSELLKELHELVSLDEPYIAFLAFDQESRPVGVIDARMRNYAEGSPELRAAYVEDLWVEPHVRRQGVAAALLHEVEQWARQQGLQWLGSDTTLDNLDSASWHAAVGFTEVERLVVFGKPLN